MSLLNKQGRLTPASIRLLLATLALLLLGLLMVYSASYGYALSGYSDTAGDLTHFFKRQLVAAVMGLVLLVGFTLLDYRILVRYSVWILGGTFAIIVPTAFFGRWMFGTWGQLAELARLLAIIYLAIWLAQKGGQIRSLTLGFLPFGLLVGLITGLIVLQPDMSSAILIVLIGVIIARDVLLLATAPLLATRGVTALPTLYVGKAATFALMSAFPWLLAGQIDGWVGTVFFPVGWAFLLWGVGMYVWSLVLYWIQTIDVLRTMPRVVAPATPQGR